MTLKEIASNIEYQLGKRDGSGIDVTLTCTAWLAIIDSLGSWTPEAPRTEARRIEPEVRLGGNGLLDEVVSDTAHLEQMDFNHWFLEISQGKRSVAVWLHSGTKINATYEWRDNYAPPSPRGALLDGDLAEQRKIHDQSLPQHGESK